MTFFAKNVFRNELRNSSAVTPPESPCILYKKLKSKSINFKDRDIDSLDINLTISITSYKYVLWVYISPE